MNRNVSILVLNYSLLIKLRSKTLVGVLLASTKFTGWYSICKFSRDPILKEAMGGGRGGARKRVGTK
jgi:hypothetical protein